MSTQQRVRRITGTTAANAAATLPRAVLVVKRPVDGTVWVHDDSTPGGFPVGGITALPVTVPQGGTGRTALTAHGVLLGAGTSAINIATVGTAGRVLTDQGAGSDPAFVAVATATADSVATGVAAAGSNQAGATSLTAQQNYVTGADGTKGVKIAAALMIPGGHVYVANEDASNTLVCYPDTGNSFNAQGADAAISGGIPANTTAHFIVKSATVLRSVP